MSRDIDTPGGEYVELEIKVNGNVVFKRDCVLTEISGNGQRRYKTDDTDTFIIPPRTGKPSKDTYKDIGNRLLRDKGQR